METNEEIKKSPEVELDTDGIQEQSVEVKEEKVETAEPELPREEVDLGYTQHDDKPEGIEKIKVEEIKQEEKPKEDLADYSDSVKKRIDKLTRRYREAERKEKAAVDYAKGVQKKLDDLSGRFNKTTKGYVEQYSARVEAEQAKVKDLLKNAIAEQDADKIAEANSRMATLAVEAEKAKMSASEVEANTSAQKQTQETQTPQSPSYPEPSPRAKGWAEKNEWFGTDKIMTSAAFQTHQELLDQGFDAESDEYYNEIDKVMVENFPHKFGQKQEQKKPVQTVASAQRNQSGRKSVKLTRSQIAIAKKLGVPLEEYAKFVKENANG